MQRFLSDDRITRQIAEFYREEFLKHRQCLQLQREYYSELAFAEVDAALLRIISEMERLCCRGNIEQLASHLLRKIDVVTKLSTASPGTPVH